MMARWRDGAVARWQGLLLLVVFALFVTACGDDDSASPDPARFCEVSADFAAAGDFLDTSPEEASRIIPEVRSIFERGIAAAPSEIRDDYKLVVDAFLPILDVYEDSDFGAGEVDQSALEAALLAFATPEVQTASSDIEAWISANCG